MGRRILLTLATLALVPVARADEPPADAPAEADAATLRVRAVDAARGAPLPGARVRLEGEGTSVVREADEGGAVTFEGLAPGRWRARVLGEGLVGRPARRALAPGEAAELTVVAVPARPWEEDDDEVVEVVGRSAPEVLERRIEAADLAVLPGTFGDPVRAVHNLPGVARAPLNLGAVLIRGKAPEDTAYSVDGLDVPLVFHFGGLTAVLPGDLVEELVYLPGNQGVRYGRTLGGRVELRTRTRLPERTRGHVALDVFQASGLAEVRLGDRTAMTFSLRRSYVDAVLDPVLSDDARTVRAPRFWDGQLRVVHELPGRGSLDGLLMVSDDRFQTLGADADPDEAAAYGYRSTFAKGLFRWRTALAGGWRSELSVGIGPERRALALLGDDAFEEDVRVDVREELVLERDEGVSWRVGVDVQGGHRRYRYAVDAFGPPEEGRAPFVAPAFYLEPTLRAGPVTATLGLRTELFSWPGLRTLLGVDPRGALRVEVAPGTVVRAAFGRHTSFPPLRQVLPPSRGGDGDPDLEPGWAVHTSVGVDQRLPHGLSLEATFWYDQLHDLVVGREERFRFFQVPPSTMAVDGGPYANEGTGRTYGLEALLRLQSRRVTAWLSATFGRSQRTGRVGGPVLYEFDQPVVLTALATGRLPRGWRLGARLRYATGVPYTPVLQRVLDLNGQLFLPLFGDPASARVPPVFSLDLRVDKEWIFRRWALTLYLDVQNVTNGRPLEIVGWSHDFARLDGISGLPVLPVLGMKASF